MARAAVVGKIAYRVAERHEHVKVGKRAADRTPEYGTAAKLTPGSGFTNGRA
jgi:hypothetical protein